MSERHDRLKARTPLQLAARLLLDQLDAHNGPTPVWSAEKELLRAALIAVEYA